MCCQRRGRSHWCGFICHFVSWLQLTIAVRTREAAHFEEVLLANGAVAITFESQVDEVVLEPAPGEIPLWERISLLALFP